VAQQWALGKTLEGLQPYFHHISRLLLRTQKPITNTDRHIFKYKAININIEDLIQEVNLCALEVLRAQRLKGTLKLRDYLKIILRELLNRKGRFICLDNNAI